MAEHQTAGRGVETGGGKQGSGRESGWGVWWPWAAAAGVFLAIGVALVLEGRLWFCKCGQIRVWITDVWTEHCSQHLADPYSITHVSHGMIFWMALRLLRPAWEKAGWRGLGLQVLVSTVIAGAWEVLENSEPVINRYRTETMSLNYMGDSVVNALADVASCVLGLLAARKIGFIGVAAYLVVSELALLALIRDNLTLNVIMLIHPIEAIKAWQAAGQ